MPAQSFALTTPEDLLEKLEREFDRFLRASQPDSDDHTHQSDYAFNFCVTAYHMIDWVWEYEHRVNGVNRPYGHSNRYELAEEVCDDHEAVAVCRDIANGSKHFATDPDRDSRLQSTEVRLTNNSGMGAPGDTPFGPPGLRSFAGTGVLREELWINLEDGDQRKAESVFKEALSFWQQFLRNCS